MSYQTSVVLAVVSIVLIWPLIPVFSGVNKMGVTRWKGYHTFLPALVVGSLVLAWGNIISWEEFGALMLASLVIACAWLAGYYLWKNTPDAPWGERAFYALLAAVLSGLGSVYVAAIFIFSVFNY